MFSCEALSYNGNNIYYVLHLRKKNEMLGSHIPQYLSTFQ